MSFCRLVNPWINPLSTIIPADGLCYEIGVIDSSVLQEIFSSLSKCLTCKGEKKSWDKIKRMGRYLT